MPMFLLSNNIAERYGIPKLQTRPLQEASHSLSETGTEKEFDAGHHE